MIVNTCGFISEAKKESIETSLELKARHPGKKVIMVGCLTERYGSELSRQLPEIDGFLGNRDPAGIVDLVEGRAGADREAAGDRPADGGASEPGRQRERTRLLSFPGSAYVKVAEGCSNRCTYCAIPLIRGELSSRDGESIVAEIRGLVERGVRELILIAQDLGSFGADRGKAGLPRLLTGIARLPGDFWVRLLYIHPDRFPEDILDVMEGDPRFLPYFDLPFQHASPAVLRAMGRRGEPERNLALLARIRDRLPRAVIRSTFLLGFPGETDADFRQLLDFQGDARLDWLGAFTYSREEDTPAWDMPGRVPRALAEARKKEIELGQVPITERALDSHLGRVLDVLVEERVEGEEMCLGRAYLQAPDVDGLIVVRGVPKPGQRVRVRITRRNGVDLEGDAAVSDPAYLQALNPEQKEAVVHQGGPLLILAGAGSGKTRVITTKIAYLVDRMGVSPRSILAVTFTNKAAQEMKERVLAIVPHAEEVMVRTFHSFGAWFLRVNAVLAGLSPRFHIYDEEDSLSLLKSCLGTGGGQRRLSAGDLRRDQPGEGRRGLLRTRRRRRSPGPAATPRSTAPYETALRRTGNVDFGDLILLPIRLLRGHPEVRERTRQRFSVVLVDEYQDSNVAQFELLKELWRPETYLCVVGDDDQSIYRFRGAEVGNILSFPDVFPGTKIVRLERNYRSTQSILDVAIRGGQQQQGQARQDPLDGEAGGRAARRVRSGGPGRGGRAVRAGWWRTASREARPSSTG